MGATATGPGAGGDRTGPRTAEPPWATVRLFGFDFVAASDVDVVADELFDTAGDRALGWRCVVTPNVDHLVRYEREAEEAEAGRAATVVLPDGMPIVWASRLLRRRLPARLTGVDLFARLWARTSAAASPIVAIVSRREVADRLTAMNPRAHCLVPPMFSVDDPAAFARLADEVVEACRRTNARFVVVGISMPKHHRLANRLRAAWTDEPDPPIVLLLGASPDFIVGLTRRAPAMMRRAGLEWLHRLALDPRRMAKRYLVDDPRFLRLVARQWWDQRRARRSA